ncbi:MAG: efflux RND transporter permease subunit [Luteibaculaceae bacterium]
MSTIEKLLTPRIAIGILLTFSVLLVLSLPSALKVAPHYNFEDFIPESSPNLTDYENFKEKFGYEHEFIVLGLKPKKGGIFNDTFYTEVQEIALAINQIPFVDRVNSPFSIKLPRIVGAQLFEVTWLKGNDFTEDSLKVLNEPGLSRQFFSKNLDAVSFILETKPGLSRNKSDSLLYNLNTVLKSYPSLESYKAGRIPGQFILLEALEKQLKIFAPLAFFLLCIILWFSFRSVWGVWAPMLVVASSAYFLVTLLELTGQKLNILNVLLPTILLVVGTSDTVHLTSRYYEQLRKTKNKIKALALSLKEVGTATLLTTLTTAVGFGALIVSPVKPVKEFGLYAALGVIIAYILSFTVYPAILLLLPEPTKAILYNNRFNWSGLTSKMLKFSIYNRKSILISGFLLLALGIFSATQLRVNNYLIDDLRASHPGKKEYRFFEENFSGSRPLEWVVETKEQANLDLLLPWLNQFQAELESGYGTQLLSLPTLAKEINRALNNGEVHHYKIPTDSISLAKVVRSLKQIGRKKLEPVKQENTYRFSGRISDIGSKLGEEKEAELMQWVNENPPPVSARVFATGVAPLIDKSNSVLAYSLLQSLFIAFVVVGILMAIIFKDVSMLPVAFFANALPLAGLWLFMYALNFELKIATGLIFSVAFGIAVDDTIHFLSKYLLERKQGRGIVSALQRTILHAGKAIIITTLLLLGGFATLLFSVFGSTFYLGLFLCLTLFLAVFADLLVLPALLYRKGK